MIPYSSYINVRENRRGNQEWTIQRYWQHLGAQNTGQRQTKHKNTTKHRKLRMMSNTDPVYN